MGAIGAMGLAGCGIDERSESTNGTEDETGTAAGAVVQVNADVGIVGAGIAGLACAYELKRAGCAATLHEASTRVGGRIWSMGGAFAGPVMFPGQVVERGGELIDTPHKAMLGYAKEFGLAREDVAKPVRDTVYRFGGQFISEQTMVDEYRDLVDAMKADLHVVGAPTAMSFTPAEQALDQMSLREWLDARGAGTNIKRLLNVAYAIEYGLETDELSCLSFLLFAKASRQAKLRLWGNFSDERYHLVGGNEQVITELASRLPNQILTGRRLVAAKKTAAGRIELTFKEGASTITATHDAVVFALPFNVLRDVQFHASMGLPAWKQYAIQNIRYGTNAKLMVGFTGRPWIDVDSNGAAYSDLAHLQTTWETNPSQATSTRAVITDFTGGALGLSLSNAQTDTAAFLDDFDVVYPGAKALARKDAQGKYVAHLQHWPSDLNTKGSYTANQPGYFTTIADNEATAVGNAYFAGETTSSFYEWQGFMEGGALSGKRAAAEIIGDFG